MSQVVKQVVERVRVARLTEQQAREAARVAEAERKAAEADLQPAQQQAKAAAAVLSQGVMARLGALEAQLDRVKAREAVDTVVPDPSMRIRARALLLGGGDAANDDGMYPVSGPRGLTSLVSLDAIAGAWYEASRQGGALMTFIFDEGGNDELAERADRLETMAWSGLMRRIRHLAGEDAL